MHRIDKVPKGYNITLTRGDSLTIKVSIKKNGASYTPAEGASLRFAMKTKGSCSPTLVKSIPVDTMILDIKPGDTKSLPVNGRYIYDIELTEGEVVDTFITGQFILAEEVV